MASVRIAEARGSRVFVEEVAMNWWESLVQLHVRGASGGIKGSGIFLSEAVVLTAAHVVAPGGIPRAPNDLTIEIRYLESTAKATRISVLPKWRNAVSATADIALVRVEPVAGTGVKHLRQVPPPDEVRRLRGYGFFASSDDLARLGPGDVRSTNEHDGLHALLSDELVSSPGVSGGPLTMRVDTELHVVGVITRRSGSGLLGVPLLNENLGQLFLDG